MITIKEFPNKEFTDLKSAFAELVANKATLIAQKKMTVKHADPIFAQVEKSVNKSVEVGDGLKVKSVINTTNIMDSHSDVHLPGLWKKSVSENKNLYLLQEHQMTFSHIISDEVKASIMQTTFKDLGINLEGSTEALVFESILKSDRNPFMFSQYSKGFVKNHSVGMQYMKIDLAVNDSEWEKEFKLFNDTLPKIANKTEAEEQGYFFVVTEAKVMEGSAVPIGSNWATPTISVEAVGDTPTKTTEPPQGTQDENKGLVFIKLKENV